MAVRKVMRLGHPILRAPARPLTPDEIVSDDIEYLLADMVDTLHDYGGIGLAAPQIAEPIRLLLLEIPAGGSRYGELEDLPLTVCANPEVTVVDPSTAGFWEGCLSVPGLRGFVERPQHIAVTYTDVDGEPQALELKGFQATVFQHEFDHLNGVLYVDRITDPSLFAFEDEFARYHTGEEID